MATEASPKFSWVRARAECSLMEAFNRIRLQVHEDVDERKALRTPSESEWLNFNMASNGNAFTVGRLEHKKVRSVTFRIGEGGIQVIDENDKPVLEGTLTLGDDGQCRLKVADRNLEFWQFRRAALENLFF
jgi:hypothetical protein